MVRLLGRVGKESVMSHIKCYPSTLEGTEESEIRIAVFNFELRTYKLPTKKARRYPAHSIFIPKYALFIWSLLELNIED
jgi:hypothetical protein